MYESRHPDRERTTPVEATGFSSSFVAATEVIYETGMEEKGKTWMQEPIALDAARSESYQHAVLCDIFDFRCSRMDGWMDVLEYDATIPR
jgi:hypothetical protein